MAQAPQHPGNQQAPKPSGAEFYTPNQGRLQSEALAAQAAADKARAETAILQQSQGLAGNGIVGQRGLAPQQQVAPGPQVSPQQVQAEQLADAITNGQVGEEQLQALVQSGEVTEDVARAAVGMSQQMQQAAAQQYNGQQGL